LVWLAGLFDQGERGGLKGANGSLNFLARKGADVAALGEFDLYNIFKDISEYRYGGTVKGGVGGRDRSDAGIKAIKNGGR